MLRYFEAFLEYVRQQGIYIYRGDTAVADFGIGDFTRDNAWHELQLPPVVPEHAKAVDVTIATACSTNNETVSFKRHGQVNSLNAASFSVQTGLIVIHGDLTIPVDTDRKIDYKFTIGGWYLFSFTVKGWWY